jgi:hypothetical protein
MLDMAIQLRNVPRMDSSPRMRPMLLNDISQWSGPSAQPA